MVVDAVLAQEQYVPRVMEVLVHDHYESMSSSTALVYRRSHMCRFECNVRMCAEKLLS